MDTENKKEYEISFLLTSLESEKEFAGTLAKLGAEIFYQKPVAELRLAYKIKKHDSAYFGLYHFKASPDIVKGVKEALNLNTNVLRFLIITPPVKLASAEQPRQQVRPERKETTPILSNEALSEKLEEILK